MPGRNTSKSRALLDDREASRAVKLSPVSAGQQAPAAARGCRSSCDRQTRGEKERGWRSAMARSPQASSSATSAARHRRVRSPPPPKSCGSTAFATSPSSCACAMHARRGACRLSSQSRALGTDLVLGELASPSRRSAACSSVGSKSITLGVPRSSRMRLVKSLDSRRESEGILGSEAGLGSCLGRIRRRAFAACGAARRVRLRRGGFYQSCPWGCTRFAPARGSQSEDGCAASWKGALRVFPLESSQTPPSMQRFDALIGPCQPRRSCLTPRRRRSNQRAANRPEARSSIRAADARGRAARADDLDPQADPTGPTAFSFRLERGASRSFAHDRIRTRSTRIPLPPGVTSGSSERSRSP